MDVKTRVGGLLRSCSVGDRAGTLTMRLEGSAMNKTDSAIVLLVLILVVVQVCRPGWRQA